MILHRPRTVKNDNKFSVLDDGRVVEQGWPTELLATKAVFQRSWEDQKFC